MDVILIALMLFALLSIRIAPSAHGGTLPYSAMLPVRGLFAVLIVLHHVSQKISAGRTYLFWYMPKVGFLCVSVFFVFSGYALSAQYRTHGQRYIEGFWKNRLKRLLPPYLFASLILMLLTGIQTYRDGLSVIQVLARSICDQFRTGTTVLPYSWYVEVILALYLFFYIGCLLFPRHRTGVYAVIFTGILALICLFQALDYGDWWYKSILAFPAGMLYHDISTSEMLRRLTYKKKAARWLPFLLLLLILPVFFFCWNRHFHDSASKLLMTECSAMLFGICILLFLQNFRLRTPVLDYLGTRSYAIYLSQSIPMALIELKVIEIWNPIVYLLAVLSGSILCGEIVLRLTWIFSQRSRPSWHR